MSATLSKLRSLTEQAKGSGTNKTAVVAWGILIGLGLFALYYFKIEPVYGWMTGFFAWAGSTINSLTNGLDLGNIGKQISDYITANPIVAITGVIGVSGGLLALYERSQRIREKNLKLAAQEAEEYAKIQSSAVTDNLAYYKQEAESAKAELTAIKETNITQQFQTAKAELTTAQTTIQTLEKQLEKARQDLQNTPIKIVKVAK